MGFSGSMQTNTGVREGLDRELAGHLLVEDGDFVTIDVKVSVLCLNSALVATVGRIVLEHVDLKRPKHMGPKKYWSDSKLAGPKHFFFFFFFRSPLQAESRFHPKERERERKHFLTM